ncbi:Preprotein translocase subunit SecG [Liberibacter crescens BT-1]|uniref:Protein-export membrane protein SecG n=1 Tax=Liberibacter crescens (strain BT-1) TaxID=1215343 RepID=L0ESH0_LIBCB|nr:preprotein translocase subunit SecG [Liberibacter crescens]AGA64454.1 Preprotein translocase subunit SecG [Liberibacter crescens BT-1]
MQIFVIIVHFVVVIALVGVVLIQRSEGGILGMGDGSRFLSPRGAVDALTRITAILAGLFFITSIVLGILLRYDYDAKDIINRIPKNSEKNSGILDSLSPPNSSHSPGKEGKAVSPLQNSSDIPVNP